MMFQKDNLFSWIRFHLIIIRHDIDFESTCWLLLFDNNNFKGTMIIFDCLGKTFQRCFEIE